MLTHNIHKITTIIETPSQSPDTPQSPTITEANNNNNNNNNNNTNNNNNNNNNNNK